MPTVGTTLCDNSNCKAAVREYEICVFGNLGKTRMFVYRYRGIGGRSRDETHSGRGEYTRYIYQFDKSVVTKLIRGGSRISQTACANILLPTAREGKVFTAVCLSTISLMDTGSLLGLVTVRSVRILLECFLVYDHFCRKLHENERIWTEESASLAPPLRPATPNISHFLIL